jgi:hypothetical protein
MRKLLLVLALVSLTGCAQMKAFGQGVCATQAEISAGITEIGTFFGTPGKIFTDAFNIILNSGCKVFSAVLALPDDGATVVTEMFSDEPEAPVENDPGN